jgi:hypothetical protein
MINLSESSNEGYGSKRAAFPKKKKMMMMMNIKFNKYPFCGFREDGC